MSLKKKTELAQLSRDAKTLYAEMEADASKQTAENREKLDKYIESGKTLRADIDRAETLDEFAAFTGEAAEKPGADAAGLDGIDVDSKGRKNVTARSYGEHVIASDQFKNANRSRGEMAGVDVGNLVTRIAGKNQKAIFNTTDAQGGHAVRADREAEILDIARQRPFTVMDLINVGQTQMDAVEYVLFATRTNNSVVVPEWDAAIVPGEGDFANKFGDKPQGDLTLDLKTAVVKTIAQWIPASRQILNDAPNLRSMIDNELMYMIEFYLENQIIAGTGTGNEFTGMLNSAGVQTRFKSATVPTGRGQLVGDTLADTLRRAITDISLAFYDADGIILNPADAEKLELEKGSDGHYVQMYDPIAMRIWRKPVRESVAMPSGTALVGAFKIGAKLWDREQSNIRVGEPGNFFLQNAVAILAELRAAFAVVRPLAIEKVTGL